MLQANADYGDTPEAAWAQLDALGYRLRKSDIAETALAEGIDCEKLYHKLVKIDRMSYNFSNVDRIDAAVSNGGQQRASYSLNEGDLDSEDPQVR